VCHPRHRRTWSSQADRLDIFVTDVEGIARTAAWAAWIDILPWQGGAPHSLSLASSRVRRVTTHRLPRRMDAGLQFLARLAVWRP
jgi:hypothetical protein